MPSSATGSPFRPSGTGAGSKLVGAWGDKVGEPEPTETTVVSLMVADVHIEDQFLVAGLLYLAKGRRFFRRRRRSAGWETCRVIPPFTPWNPWHGRESGCLRDQAHQPDQAGRLLTF